MKKNTTKKLSNRNLDTVSKTGGSSRKTSARQTTGRITATHRNTQTVGGGFNRTTAARARDLARIARDLDEHKDVLAYGEFEKWALKTYTAFPIQVLRYLRKAHRVFGKDLEKLFDRYGQKKVFLLLGLDDPWAPIRQGVTVPGAKSLTNLDTLSVKQLRDAIRDQVRHVTTARRGRKSTLLGGLTTVYDRLSSLWPRLRNAPVATIGGPRATGTRQRLERFRNMLEEVLGKIDQVLTPPVAGRIAPTASRTPRTKSRR